MPLSTALDRQRGDDGDPRSVSALSELYSAAIGTIHKIHEAHEQEVTQLRRELVSLQLHQHEQHGATGSPRSSWAEQPIESAGDSDTVPVHEDKAASETESEAASAYGDEGAPYSPLERMKPTRRPRKPEHRSSHHHHPELEDHHHRHRPEHHHHLDPPSPSVLLPKIKRSPTAQLPDVTCYTDVMEIAVPVGKQGAARTLRAAFQAIRAMNRLSPGTDSQSLDLLASKGSSGSSNGAMPKQTVMPKKLRIDPEFDGDEEEEAAKAQAQKAKMTKAREAGSGVSSHSLTLGTASHTHWVPRAVVSSWWEVVYALMVIIELITIGITVQLSLLSGPQVAASHRLLGAAKTSAADEYTLDDAPSDLSSVKIYCIAAENILTFYFLFDVVTRFLVLGWQQFVPNQPKRVANFLDIPLTLVTNILFVWILPLAGVDTLTSNVYCGLKIFRFVRVRRVVSTISENKDLFKEVALMIRGLSVSGRSFLSALAFISFVTYLFGVIGCVTIVRTLRDMALTAQDDTERAELEYLVEHLGTVGNFVFALSEFASKNPHILPPILKYIKNSWMLFYAYGAFLDLVVMNVIEAVFVEGTFANSEAQEQSKLLTSLNELFVLMDEDGDGTLSWSEFRQAFADKEISEKWKQLDINQSECKELFSLLDPGDGNIPMDDFFDGLTRMKGQALSKDVFRIMKMLDDLIQAISIMFEAGPSGLMSMSPNGDQSELNFLKKHHKKRHNTVAPAVGRDPSSPSMRRKGLSRVSEGPEYSDSESGSESLG